jgi:hypothetical protein
MAPWWPLQSAAGGGASYNQRRGLAGLAGLLRGVGDPGLEPGTSSLSEKRSNRLS